MNEFTLKIACKVRRCKSVKTSLGFFGDDKCSTAGGISSFLLQPVNGMSNRWMEQNIKFEDEINFFLSICN